MVLFPKHENQVVSAPHYSLYAQWPHRHSILLKDKNVGIGFTDTFVEGLRSDAYDITDGDTGSTVLIDATTASLELTTDNTDNDEVYVQAGNGTSAPFLISDSDRRPLIFCARFKFSDVSSAHFDFVGLADIGFSAADQITDAGAFAAATDVIGFHRPEGDPDSLDFVYKEASGSLNTVVDGAVALTADTYVTVGFYFDGTVVYPFYDGAFDKDNVVDMSTSPTDFPDGVNMHMAAGHKNGSANANVTSIDFWEVQQLTV